MESGGGWGVRHWSGLDLVLWTVVITAWCSHGHQHRLFFKRQDRCAGQVLSPDLCHDGFQTRGKSQCGAECGQRAGCLSFVWDPDTRICRLCNATVDAQCSNTHPADRQQTFEMRCQTAEERTREPCQCPPAWDGPHCENRMTDCEDWKAAGHTVKGAKWIHPALSPQPFVMRCNPSWNRGVIFSRYGHSLDFYRNWTQYAEGFGDVTVDHWLGLRKIYQLTQSPGRCYTLSVQVTLTNMTYYQRYYRQFTLSPEHQHFAIHFNTTFPWGNPLGDCLSAVRDKPFTTYDADHDDDAAGNCAERHHSGWWFGNCTVCNPTGEFTEPADGIRTSDREVYWVPGLGDLVPRGLKMMLSRC